MTVVITFRYCTDMFCYVIAVCEETRRQDMYCDFTLRSVRANIGGGGLQFM